MTDTSTTDQSAPKEDANLEQLRAKAARADELEAKLAAREKQDAFRAAGIDPTSGPGQLLFDNFSAEGDLTADVVRAEAEKYGIKPTTNEPSTPAPQENPAVNERPQQDLSFFEDTSSIATGSSTDAPKAGGFALAKDAFTTVRGRGGNDEDAAKAAIAEVMTAAAEGDTSVIYNQEEWRRTNG